VTALALADWDAVWQRFYDRGVILGLSPNASIAIPIKGFCPMGCGETLIHDEDERVVCVQPGCPRPDSVDEILADAETEHQVVFTDSSFTVRHPLRERLDDALMQCPLGEHIAALDGPPVSPGRYRALAEGEDEWSWWPVEVSS
jgi:hypothetical protein